ncbi:MAG TPA: diacylglycerol kinase family protein [Patescibacteria group bacterium]|nr:diacylglycerol kinase family protein [Patescibacteria group bacterium]
MRHIIKHHTISFKNAFSGFVWALSTQPNYVIHMFLSSSAIVAGFYFHIIYSEWLAIIILITVGFTIETINTAIEVTTDAISKEHRLDIKIAKDLSAGAMLIFSFGAVLITCIIFLPKIFN